MADDNELDGALDRLVEHHYDRLVRAVALFSGSTEGAEDAVQEAFARALEHTRKGRTIDRPEAWVITTAFNHVRSGARRDARRRARSGPADHGPVTVDAETPGAHLVDLRAAVRALPKRQREAIVMHYFLDLSVSSIAGALGVGENAVKNALHKGRESLRGALALDDSREWTR